MVIISLKVDLLLICIKCIKKGYPRVAFLVYLNLVISYKWITSP